jgi:AsmA-like C-terminal region
MKKILIALGVIIALLLSAAVAIPYFFKDEIVAAVKKSANDNLTATLDFKDVDISLFRQFPKLSIGLEDLRVTNGKGPFEGIQLLQTRRLDVAVDLWAAIMDGKVIVRGLDLYEPDVRVFVLSDGSANYDITIATDETATVDPNAEPIKLERYAIHNGKILYDDRGLDMRAELEGLEHTGSGDLYTEVYDLAMKTEAQSLSLNYGGIRCLSHAHVIWNAGLNADLGKMRFVLKQNEAKINDLALNLDGWVELPNETDTRMDITFGTPQNTFKSLLSIIPGAYTKDFEQVKADGTVALGGFARGTYNETTYPAFKLDFKVANGAVKYPSLPLGISQINVDAAINSPSSSLNAMTVAIPKFGLQVGSNPLSGHFNAKTLVTDPTVDTRLNGTLNLGELAKAFPMEGVSELAGIIKADVALKAAQSQLDKAQYEQVNVAGTLGVSGITYRATGSPDVRVQSLQTAFSPQKVTIDNFDAKLGKSDIQASGSIDNVLAYFSTNKTMRGTLNMRSNTLDLNEWMTPATGTDAATTVPNDVPAAATEKVFDRWDFTVDGRVGNLLYDTYKINDFVTKGHFTPNKMSVSDFGLKMGQSDLSGDGNIANAWNYLFDNQTVTGVINLRSNYFDLNEFMAEPTTTTTAAAEPAPAAGTIPVPEHMDMTINANMAKVRYTNLDLNSLNGAVIVKNEEAKLDNCTADLLGGRVALNGGYNTQDASKPAFNMDMALQNFGFREAFQHFATVKSLAPVAQLMDGKFNTTLSMSGLLGKDMMPELSMLNAAGFLETISAVLNNFEPLKVVGDKLGVDYLRKAELGNTKNWFEIVNGAVTVKPFDTKVRDVAMRIGGTHSVANEMNYQIFTKIPRKALGQAANGGINLLSSEASKYGVNIAQGEYINTRFDVTGSLFKPKVAMRVLGSDGESTLQETATATAEAVVDKAKDSITNMANRELDRAKDKAKQAADRAADSLRRLADKAVEEAKRKAAEEAKDQVGKVLGSETGQKVGDQVGKKVEEGAGKVLGDQGKKTVEDAKNKLDKWDPFKKKKSGN